MNRSLSLLLGLVLGAALVLGGQKLASWAPFSRTQGETRSAPGDEILVMRTRGGLLEVSRVEATEVFDARFVYEVLGIAIGETVPRIRVPAVYRYHVELAPAWNVLRTGDRFTVVAPPVKPTLPVAVDLGRMERDVAGSWVLLPFTADRDLDDLQRTITAKLAARASGPAYLQLQREHARQTVTEFVHKWLLTQAPWQSATQPRLEVYFADEPIGSLDRAAALLGTAPGTPAVRR